MEKEEETRENFIEMGKEIKLEWKEEIETRINYPTLTTKETPNRPLPLRSYIFDLLVTASVPPAVIVKKMRIKIKLLAHNSPCTAARKGITEIYMYVFYDYEALREVSLKSNLHM